MKMWYGFGSEHSANIVMIGEFKTEADAIRVQALIEEITTNASSDLAEGIINTWSPNEQFSESTEAILRRLKLHSFSPADIADFAIVSPSISRSGKALTFRTDDVDIGGFIKLLISTGAKVQVYSAHEYPDAQST